MPMDMDLDAFYDVSEFAHKAVRRRVAHLDSEPFPVHFGASDDETHQGYVRDAIHRASFAANDVRAGDMLLIVGRAYRVLQVDLVNDGHEMLAHLDGGREL